MERFNEVVICFVLEVRFCIREEFVEEILLIVFKIFLSEVFIFDGMVLEVLWVNIGVMVRDGDRFLVDYNEDDFEFFKFYSYGRILLRNKLFYWECCVYIRSYFLF